MMKEICKKERKNIFGFFYRRRDDIQWKSSCRSMPDQILVGLAPKQNRRLLVTKNPEKQKSNMQNAFFGASNGQEKTHRWDRRTGIKRALSAFLLPAISLACGTNMVW